MGKFDDQPDDDEDFEELLENAVIHRLFLHVILTTSIECAPLTRTEQRMACELIAERCGPLGTVELIAASCTESHAHIALRFSPEISIQDIVDDLRDYTGAMLQKVRRVEPFSWDTGFAALSVTAGAELRTLKDYIGAAGAQTEVE